MNFGIIGAGFIAYVHAVAINSTKQAQLLAVADISIDAASKFAAKFKCAAYVSAEEMLQCSDIDAVIICVPPFLHEEMAVLAAKFKKHILCEKPMALTKKACVNMAKAAQDCSVVLMVAQVLRYWPEYAQVHKIVQSGAIGEIHMISAKRIGPYPSWGEWFKDPAKSGGGLMDLHLHDIDFIYHLLGGYVESIYSSGPQSANKAYDEIFTTLRYCGGVSASIFTSNQMPTGYPFTMELCVYGTTGAVEIKIGGGNNIENTKSCALLYCKEQPMQNLKTSDEDAYQVQLSAFISAVQGNAENIAVPLSESLSVIDIMQDIAMSLAENRIIQHNEGKY